jgi:hypothetical protein
VVQSAFYLDGNIPNIQRNNILKGKVAVAANKVTGQHRIFPCKSARLGINGLIDAVQSPTGIWFYIHHVFIISLNLQYGNNDMSKF